MSDSAPQGEATAHPTLETLAAYRAGKLSAAAEGELQEHLVTCEACTDQLLELAPFVAATVEGPPQVVDFEAAAAWRQIRGALTAETAKPASPHWLRALAAGLAAACLGLAFWGYGQQRAAARWAPMTDVAVLYLDSTTRGAGEEPSVVETTGEEDLFLLMVSPQRGDTGAGPAQAYRLSLLDSTGAHLWSSSAMTLNEYGSLRLMLSRQRFAPGVYRLQVTALPGDPGAPEELGEYRFEIR